MKVSEIKKIANRISKEYGMPNVIIEKNKEYVEVRSELTTNEGGMDLLLQVGIKLGYHGESEGGCVYRFYKD